MKKVDLSIFYPKKPRADDGEPVVLPFYVKALIIAACLAIAFTGGFFLGQDRSHNIIIEPSAVISSEPSSEIVPSESSDAGELRSLPSPDANESDGRININTASVSELMTLPGIGEGLARRIVEY
ncbi:MAG: helix-hairpin-helix domain-containing protein, partial [Oscillospiraceae bacterium]|nr:helix-hairpin-helix domain-containing protein [Oscillospiraceae bacterium]